MNVYFKNLRIGLLTLVLLAPINVEARPVSYPGGWTLMSRNDYDKNLLHIHYSPTAKYSLGYQTAYWKGKGYQTHALKVNRLLKRWNFDDAQANTYLKSGFGGAYDSSADFSNNVEPHAFAGLAVDWENRRFFTGYGNNYEYSGKINEEFSQFLHLGVTPYIGEYGDLHTWLMLRIDHSPKDRDDIIFTPHLRFFKGEYMFEIGYSENKEILANLVVRF